MPNLTYIENFQKNTDDEIQKQALENLVVANKRLVWKIALKYKKFSTIAFDVEDMYQAGIQGLMRATEKFDLSTENQFSTYATYWIKQAITRSIADYSTTIRIPVHMREKIVKLVKVENDFWGKNGRAATIEELSILLGETVEKIKELKFYQKVGNLTSLETPIGTEEGSNFGDFIEDKNIKNPEEQTKHILLQAQLDKIFDLLTDREENVLRMRYGLDDGKFQTLEEIGEKLHVTRERIRQIEAKALKKLQKPKIIRILKDFYND